MVSTVATKWTWAHRFILFFDDFFYGKKPKIKKVPKSYNDYMIKEEGYRRITEEIAARDDEMTIIAMAKIALAIFVALHAKTR